MKFFSHVACAAIAACLTPFAAQAGDISTLSPNALFKNWALSRCLGQVTPAGPARDDAIATSNAYLEFGTHDEALYEQASKLISLFAFRKYNATTASEFNTMKCIELYQSAELAELAKRLPDKK